MMDFMMDPLDLTAPMRSRLYIQRAGQDIVDTLQCPRTRLDRTYTNTPWRSHLVATHFSPASTGAPPCNVLVMAWGRS